MTTKSYQPTSDSTVITKRLVQTHKFFMNPHTPREPPFIINRRDTAKFHFPIPQGKPDFGALFLENITPNRYQVALNGFWFERDCGRMAGLDITPRPPKEGGLKGDLAGEYAKMGEWNNIEIKNSSCFRPLRCMSVFIYLAVIP